LASCGLHRLRNDLVLRQFRFGLRLTRDDEFVRAEFGAGFEEPVAAEALGDGGHPRVGFQQGDQAGVARSRPGQDLGDAVESLEQLGAVHVAELWVALDPGAFLAHEQRDDRYLVRFVGPSLRRPAPSPQPRLARKDRDDGRRRLGTGRWRCLGRAVPRLASKAGGGVSRFPHFQQVKPRVVLFIRGSGAMRRTLSRAACLRSDEGWSNGDGSWRFRYARAAGGRTGARKIQPRHATASPTAAEPGPAAGLASLRAASRRPRWCWRTNRSAAKTRR
jgi:hypothetical protein